MATQASSSPQSAQSQWVLEARERGWIARLIAPSDGSHPATVAFVVGVLGAAAFLASLLLDWQRITLQPQRSTPPPTTTSTATVIPVGLGTVGNLTSLYIGGVVALLAILGAVIIRPALALRARMAVVGGSVGLLVITVAIIRRLKESLFEVPFGSVDPNIRARLSSTYEEGAFCAIAAVVLLAAAVVLAARPAIVAQRVAEAAAAAAAVHSVAVGSSPAGRPETAASALPAADESAELAPRWSSVAAYPQDISVSAEGGSAGRL